MHGELTQPVAKALGHTATPNSIDGPLTAEIMQRTNLSAEQAAQIASNLWSLRDRLFGSPLETGQTNGVNNALPQAFADSWRSRSNDLLLSLEAIGQLVADLSSRL